MWASALLHSGFGSRYFFTVVVLLCIGSLLACRAAQRFSFSLPSGFQLALQPSMGLCGTASLTRNAIAKRLGINRATPSARCSHKQDYPTTWDNMIIPKFGERVFATLGHNKFPTPYDNIHVP